jgi:hypothetical protein
VLNPDASSSAAKIEISSSPMPMENLNSTNNSTEDTEDASEESTEAHTLPTVPPPGISNWFVLIDPRTKKETKVREF